MAPDGEKPWSKVTTWTTSLNTVTTATDVVFAMLLWPAQASAEQRVHVVAKGHTLGKIAKRYRRMFRSRSGYGAP